MSSQEDWLHDRVRSYQQKAIDLRVRLEEAKKEVRRGLYACGCGHEIRATVNGFPLDLEGHLCPVCVGKVMGAENMIEKRLLAPVQE